MANQRDDTNHVRGYVVPGWEDVRVVFEQNIANGLDIGASLCVYHRGACVVDLVGGWKDAPMGKEAYTPDTLQLVYSTSKGILAAATALCVERNWLRYDAPIVEYWPEFAAQEKQNVTVANVLAHRAGLSFVDDELSADDVFDWARITSLLAAQKPHWEPGTAHGYHAYTLGFIIGELIRRVDPQHRPYGRFVREEIDGEFYVGVPDGSVEARLAPLIRKVTATTATARVRPVVSQTDKALTCSGAFLLGGPSITANARRFQQAEIPAVNGITNARALARIYSRLMGDTDESAGPRSRLISVETLTEATKNITPAGEPDLNWYSMPTVFSQGGFQLFGECFNIIGEGAFGFTGYGGSCAFAYPPQQLAYGYACNQLDPTALTVDPRSLRVIAAIENILK